MFIYDKKDNSVDIYTIEPKKEEIKKFRKEVLQKHKNDNLFYSIRTNSIKKVLENFYKYDILVNSLDYSNDSYFDCGTWSSLYETKVNERKKEKIEKYIEGEYDCLSNSIIRVHDLWDKDLYYFLKTENPQIICHTSSSDVYEIENIMNLPKSLYLLHLLNKGKYKEIVNENIKRLLKLYEISLYKSISISDIENIISTGLMTDTMEDVLNKTETGAKILIKLNNGRIK